MARYYNGGRGEMDKTKGPASDEPFPRELRMDDIPYVKGALAEEQYPDSIGAIDAYQSGYAKKVGRSKNKDYPKADKIQRYMPGFGKDL